MVAAQLSPCIAWASSPFSRVYFQTALQAVRLQPVFNSSFQLVQICCTRSHPFERRNGYISSDCYIVYWLTGSTANTSKGPYSHMFLGEYPPSASLQWAAGPLVAGCSIQGRVQRTTPLATLALDTEVSTRTQPSGRRSLTVKSFQH